jgi:hypothetical protein
VIRVSGAAASDQAIDRLSDRWHEFLMVQREPAEPDGVTLVRPDGHIGLRSAGADADADALAAIDDHLDGYLIPTAAD